MSLQASFTAIPPCLRMALSSWGGSSKTTLRILPEKTLYNDGETIVFHFPSSGVYDFANATLGMGINLTTNSTTITVSLPQGAAACIKRMELSAGGQTLYGGSSGQDWSTAWVYRHLLAQPGYQKSSSRAAYEYPSVTYPTAGPYQLQALIPEVHALAFKNLRFAPVGAFPQDMQLRLTLDIVNRLPPTSNVTYNSVSPVLYLQKWVFPEAFNPELVLARALETSVFSVALEQFIVNQSPAQTSGLVSFPVATNSLDYLLALFKASTITPTNFFDSQYPTGATLAYDVNMVSTANWAINGPAESYMYTMQALDGGWNIGVDPQLSAASYNAAAGSGGRFCLLERFCLPKSTWEDASVSGLSTVGSTVPLHLNVQGSSASLTPVMIAIVTSLVQIARGRQVSVLM